MERITFNSKVNSDGVLEISLPLGAANSGQDVKVTVEPASTTQMTQEEWVRWIEETAGKWEGEFERPPQGEYEQRDPLW